MSNYTKSTNFATKDNLSPGDPLKIVRGTEIDTEFNNISTAISTKTDNSAAAITGGSITGITDLAIADGGTGASTATAALNNLLPSQTSNANKYLQTDGTNVSWDAVSLSTSDITGTLPVANGGTGITSFGTGIATFLGTPSSANLISAVTDETGSGALVFANTPTLVAPILGTPTSGNFSTGTFTWPTFNQNTTGTAAGLSATLAIASGGTGQTTANAAFNALAPSQTSASGKYLKSDGTNTSWDALDISTADITGTLPIANGGTGATTAGGALTSLGAYAASNPSGYTTNTGTVTSVGGTGTVNGLTLTGTVTTSGNLTLGGTLSGVSLTSQVSGTLPTANGGTNLTSFTSGGVVYASSTSALATGSVLTFDGTTLGVTNTGTAWLTKLNDTTNNNSWGVYSDSAGMRLLSMNNAYSTFKNMSFYGSPFVFYENGTEAMRLTSTSLYTASGINVGFGTSSPAYKLDVQGGASSFATSGGYQFYWQRTGISKQFGFSSDSSGTYLNNVTDSVTGILQISNSGNLGLGVTPSAWDTTVFRTLQVGTGAGSVSLSGRTDGVQSMGLGGNFYYGSGSFRYVANGTATWYNQQSGVHTWYYAGSGTAGNAISFTQAMTLDASGALIVGTTTAQGEKATFQSSTISSANIGIVQIRSTKAADSGDCLLAIVKQANDDTTSQVFVRFGINGYAQGCGQINANGASQAAFGSFSDYRLKENIESLPSQLSNIMALRPVEFDYKNGSGHQVGFIAQEMEQVYPDAIGVGEDEMLTITGWSKTEARLVKAIQEQQAIIESLKARLDAANL